MEKYRDTATRYHVTALEEENGVYKGEIILEEAPVFGFIKRRLNGLVIPFYADSEDVFF